MHRNIDQRRVVFVLTARLWPSYCGLCDHLMMTAFYSIFTLFRERERESRRGGVGWGVQIIFITPRKSNIKEIYIHNFYIYILYVVAYLTSTSRISASWGFLITIIFGIAGYNVIIYNIMKTHFSFPLSLYTNGSV